VATSSIGFDIFARDRASKVFDKVGDSADRTGSSLHRLGSGAKKLGVVAAAGFAIAGVAAVKFGGDAIGAASDLNETLSKSRIIFGTNFKAIDKWAKGGAKSMGLSRQAALEAAAGFGDMFSQIGFGAGQAAKMSTSVVQMSADLGSFNNLPTADVAERIAAGFRGEYDSLQQLIPNINAARVESVALAETGKKTAKELTAQEKAAAVLAIVHKDGARAMGDFARTSDGLANQQKILSAQFENVKAKIGQALLPAMTGIVTFANNKLIPAFAGIPGTVRGMVDKVSTAFEKLKLGDLAGRIKDAFKGIDIGDIGAKLAKQAEEWAEPIIEGFKNGLDSGDWSGLGKALGNGVIRALEGVTSLVGKISKTLSKALGKVDWVGIGIAMGKQAPSLVAGLAVGLINFDIGSLLKGLAEHWQEALLAVITVAFLPAKFIGWVGKILGKIPFVGKLLEWALVHFKKFSDGMVGMVGKALGFLGRAFMSGFRRVFPKVGQAFGEALKLFPLRLQLMALDLQAKALKMMRGLAAAIGRGIGAVVAKIGETIARMLKPFANAGVWLIGKGTAVMRGLLQGIKATASAVWAFFKGIGGKILAGVGNLSRTLWNAGTAVIQGLIDGITAKLGALKDKLSSVTNFIKDHKGPLDKDRKLLTPAGIAIMEGLIAGIESRKPKLTTVLGKLTAFIKAQGQKLSDLIGKRNDLAGQFSGFTSSVFGQDLSNQETGAAPTASGLVAFQKAQQAKAAQLKADVTRLLKMGLSKDLIQQLASSGESGIAQIHALAQGSAADVAALNSSNAATNALLAQTGMLAGNAVFGGDIAKAQQSKAIAEAIAKEIRAWLKQHDDDSKWYVMLDGKVLHQALLKRRRDTKQPLGLEA